MAESEFR